ncbi:hypothetical protein SDD30_15455 [Moorella naiadis]|uniref:hypothetical protein n=1 Tax=Moorella naiadis (nom. illeg.) TaxID=3093670 RepID=UPI003D9C9E5D
MSLKSSCEYLNTMHRRYRQADSRAEKSQIIDEVTSTLDYNRKYAIQMLNGPLLPVAKPPAKRKRKNRQFVREIVGYERYDTPEAIAWLNSVYACLDIYANLFLPMRKVIAKERRGAHVHKSYDVAKTPFERLKEAGVLEAQVLAQLEQQLQNTSPLALHKELEDLITMGPANEAAETEAIAE